MLFVPQTNFKIIPGWILVLLCTMLIAAGVCTAGDDAPVAGMITAFRMNIRAEPDQASQVVATADKGASVEVVEVTGGIGGWAKIVYQGQTGYVRNRPRYLSYTGQTDGAAPKILVPKRMKSREQVVRRHEALTEQLNENKQKVRQMTEKEAQLMDGLNEIDYSLNQARLKAQALTRESRDLDRKIQKIQSRKKVLSQAVADMRGYAGQRLEALYRINMMGSLEVAGPPSSLFDFVVKQQAMKRVVTSDYALLASQVADLEELALLESQLQSRNKAKIELENDLAFQIRLKEKESAKRQAILKEIQKEKKWTEAVVVSLKEAADSLGKRLEAMGLSGDPKLDNTSFGRQKGRLLVPVQGKIISLYGTAKNGDYNAFTFQSGIDIKVERGEPVRSVFKGEVMFADWLKGYGNLLIINHGDNYYTLYAHVEEMFKRKGESVSTGEVIATAGDTGSIKGMQLHFEVRHHGRPVNPMAWLKIGA